VPHLGQGVGGEGRRRPPVSEVGPGDEGGERREPASAARRHPRESGGGRRQRPAADFGGAATPANLWRRRIFTGGNRFQSTALDLGDWQRSPICGIGFGKLASAANHWRSPPKIGARRLFVANAAKHWQPLPDVKILRQRLASVASHWRPSPKIGKRRELLAASAGRPRLRAASARGAPRPGSGETCGYDGQKQLWCRPSHPSEVTPQSPFRLWQVWMEGEQLGQFQLIVQ
jgi:hypothetical protein